VSRKKNLKNTRDKKKNLTKRKDHYSTPLVCYDNPMDFVSQEVPFPATHDLWLLVAGNGTKVHFIFLTPVASNKYI